MRQDVSRLVEEGEVDDLLWACGEEAKTVQNQDLRFVIASVLHMCSRSMTLHQNRGGFGNSFDSRWQEFDFSSCNDGGEAE
jgi:hypothetical protein